MIRSLQDVRHTSCAGCLLLKMGIYAEVPAYFHNTVTVHCLSFIYRFIHGLVLKFYYNLTYIHLDSLVNLLQHQDHIFNQYFLSDMGYFLSHHEHALASLLKP